MRVKINGQETDWAANSVHQIIWKEKRIVGTGDLIETHKIQHDLENLEESILSRGQQPRI